MATVMKVNHFSIYLKRNMDCTVILPSDIKETDKLPVLWLYPDSSGNHTTWLYHAPLTEYCDEGRFAMVLPEVSNNVEADSGDNYGSYVRKELVRTIHNMFPCISKDEKECYIFDKIEEIGHNWKLRRNELEKYLTDVKLINIQERK